MGFCIADQIANKDEAKNACYNYGATVAAVIYEAGQTYITFLRSKLKTCRLNNGDCQHFFIRVGKNTDGSARFIPIDLTTVENNNAILDDIIKRVSEGAVDICMKELEDKAFVGCKKAFSEVSRSGQLVSGALGAFAFAVFPGLGEGKIDVADIIAGKPFGGDGAVIPELRESVLSSLKIDGDFAALVRDPLRPVGSALQSVQSQVDKFLKNLCGDFCKHNPIRL